MRKLLVCMAILLGLMMVGAPQAMAKSTPAPTAPGSGKVVTPAAPDGYFYAYEDAYFDGEWCRWEGDHTNWVYADWLMPSDGQCWDYFIDPDMNDEVSSVWNNGFAGSYDGVKMYKHADYGDPWMCLSEGDYWADLGLGWERFSDGTHANDQISSHRWTNDC
jgi:Peptidase inhibitor family I36